MIRDNLSETQVQDVSRDRDRDTTPLKGVSRPLSLAVFGKYS